MRERITITDYSGYSLTSSGQIDASGSSTTEVWAKVEKGTSQIGIRQEINLNQNQLENAYTFSIREGVTISKNSLITWNGEEYSIIFIGNQKGYQKFVNIIAVSSD